MNHETRFSTLFQLYCVGQLYTVKPVLSCHLEKMALKDR